ncbi:MAG: methyltransferase domain-containing protein [Candidatus Thorarchaeota archaeon]
MAVAFMTALEKSPETYDKAFDEVLEGRASLIREQILGLVKPGMKVLDLGCGPGLLAMEMAKKGASVVGVDSNVNMIGLAKIRAAELENAPTFISGDILTIGEAFDRPEESDEDQFDLIISTFLLSELKPLQRDVFMHIVQTMLKDDGLFAIASEVLPDTSSDRRMFWKNRKKAEQDSGKRLASPVTDLTHLISDWGLVIEESKMYGSEIMYVTGKSGTRPSSTKYQTMAKEFAGAKARGRIWYNHLTGGWRGIPIQPGLYKSGSPTSDSPVVVTANYELTYYTVMRALAKDRLDAWVLVCDTNGINVWCAARGIHFDSDDVIHMIRLTELHKLVNHKELILPQLAAAGMDPTMIRRRTGFRVRYGPIRIHDLTRWLELEKPKPKPRDMASVTFNLRERMEQSVAHIPFLFAVLLWKPIAGVIAGLLAANIMTATIFPSMYANVFSITIDVLVLISQLTLTLIGNAFMLGLMFPILPSKANSFWRRGLGFAGITLPVALIIMLLLQAPWTAIVVWLAAQFVMATSLTMDWSGMTSVSDPKVIRREYPNMITTLKVGAAFIVIFNMLVLFMGW